MSTYHICLSAGSSGVLCRDEEDYRRLINCLAIAAYHLKCRTLAYSVMSTHLHLCARTDRARELVKKVRYMYTRYFNQKYNRNGRLGEDPYIVELKGLYHILTAIAYILRNPLHHGVAATPFGYKFSSISAIFQKELGRQPVPTLPQKLMYRHLPDGVTPPPGYLMDESGMFLPECIVDVEDVEHMFATARSYLYYMNRLSGRKWEEEQCQDNTGQPPVTMETLETGVKMNDLQTMLTNEFGRSNYNSVTDIALCEEIDSICLSNYGVRSVYGLDTRTRKGMADALMRRHHISKAQVLRCLALDEMLGS